MTMDQQNTNMFIDNVMKLIVDYNITKEQLDIAYNKCKDNLFAQEGQVHKYLMNEMFRPNVYTDIRDFYERLKNGDLCIYIDVANRYIVFGNINDYSVFMNASTLVQNNLHYQIIPIDKKQRLLFAYNGKLDGNIEIIIRQKIKEYFDTSIFIIYNDMWGCYQITTDKYVDNYSVAKICCELFCKKLYSDGIDIYQQLNEAPICKDYKNINVKYILGVIDQNTNIKDASMLEKTLLCGTVNTNVIDEINISLSSEKEYIYFIREEPYNNRVKIGKTSSNINDRLKCLQTGNPNKLVVHNYIIKNIDKKYENKLHTMYVSKRIRGEWFDFTMTELDRVIIDNM
jgi:hypothetical protein